MSSVPQNAPGLTDGGSISTYPMPLSTSACLVRSFHGRPESTAFGLYEPPEMCASPETTVTLSVTSPSDQSSTTVSKSSELKSSSNAAIQDQELIHMVQQMPEFINEQEWGGEGVDQDELAQDEPVVNEFDEWISHLLDPVHPPDRVHLTQSFAVVEQDDVEQEHFSALTELLSSSNNNGSSLHQRSVLADCLTLLLNSGSRPLYGPDTSLSTAVDPNSMNAIPGNASNPGTGDHDGTLGEPTPSCMPPEPMSPVALQNAEQVTNLLASMVTTMTQTQDMTANSAPPLMEQYSRNTSSNQPLPIKSTASMVGSEDQHHAQVVQPNPIAHVSSSSSQVEYPRGLKDMDAATFLRTLGPDALQTLL